jgi:hypothetical protein
MRALLSGVSRVCVTLKTVRVTPRLLRSNSRNAIRDEKVRAAADEFLDKGREKPASMFWGAETTFEPRSML